MAVVQNVRALLAQTTLPRGLHRRPTATTPRRPIQASLSSTYQEIIITAIVVALIVLLFLGKLNTAFSVILAIPIALSAAPVLYNLAGFTLNLVSLLALIVAIGIVVDDSIVVAENVERYRAMGFSQKESVLKGASEVFSAVVAASLSLLSVLLPVSFIGGIIGQYLRQFSLGLAAAVGFSLLEAVLFLTVRLAYTPDTDRTLDWRDLAEERRHVRRIDAMGPERVEKAVAHRGSGGRGHRRAVATKHLVVPPGRRPLPARLAASCATWAGSCYSFFQALTTTLHGWTEAGLEWVREGYAKSLVRPAGPERRGPAGHRRRPRGDRGPRHSEDHVQLCPAERQRDHHDQRRACTRGRPSTATNATTGKLEAYLLRQREVKTVQTIVGSVGVFTVGVNRPENTTMVVQLVPLCARARASTT